jgi:hypothetical protein
MPGVVFNLNDTPACHEACLQLKLHVYSVTEIPPDSYTMLLQYTHPRYQVPGSRPDICSCFPPSVRWISCGRRSRLNGVVGAGNIKPLQSHMLRLAHHKTSVHDTPHNCNQIKHCVIRRNIPYATSLTTKTRRLRSLHVNNSKTKNK